MRIQRGQAGRQHARGEVVNDAFLATIRRASHAEAAWTTSLDRAISHPPECIVFSVNEDTFPDVRWGHRPGPLLFEPLEAFIASRFGSWCLRKLRPLDRQLLGRSNGRYTVFGPTGIPLLLLTTTGKVSRQRRQTALTYQREGDRLFIIGSNFGQAMHPAWSSNLLADPKAWVTIGGNEFPVRATPLVDAEHERVSMLFADYLPTIYRSYTGRTDREMRVFALTRP